MKVEITCPQDPAIEKHCREQFGEKWNATAPDYAKTFGVEQLQKEYQEILRREAINQEWYDFALDGEGRRCVIYETGTQTPKLLVPQVRIVEQ